MAVLFCAPYVYFTDDDGAPLAGGKVYTYAAGTTAPKATYTTAAGDIENANPVELDASGRAVIFIDGAYKFTITDSADVLIRTVDNVSSFTTLDSQSDPFFESFSGNGTQTAFTMSEDLGTEEKAIYVWVDSGLLNHVTNGTFATDTGWTKGSGWTIAAGVATATGAISTAIEQTAGVTLIAGESYNVTMTITRSAGTLTPSVGGVSGTARSSSATFTETIIAGSTQTIAFTGSGFTGTLDSVTVTPAVGRGYTIVPPTGYTISGTALTFNTAPATGTGNVLVSAPLLSVGAASSAAAAAQAAEAAALAAADIAVSASGYTYDYDTDTTASDPGSGVLRFNNATLASATALYISETTKDAQAIAGDIATWDDSTSTIRGKFRMFKQSDPAVFALFNVTGTITDNGTWDTVTVAYVTGSGSFADNDDVTIQYIRNGDKGDTGATGPTGPAGSIDDLTGVPTASIATGDYVVFQDVNDSNLTKRDTVANLLALAPASPSWQNNGYVINRYHYGLVYTNESTMTMTANRLYCRPFVVGDSETFNRIGIEITSGSSGNARLGLYNWADGVPTTLLVDLGTVSTTSTAIVEVTISQALSPGVYGIAIVSDATPTVRGALPDKGVLNHFIGNATMSEEIMGLYVSHTYGALPASFGSPTYVTGGTSYQPLTFLRKV